MSMLFGEYHDVFEFPILITEDIQNFRAPYRSEELTFKVTPGLINYVCDDDVRITMFTFNQVNQDLSKFVLSVIFHGSDKENFNNRFVGIFIYRRKFDNRESNNIIRRFFGYPEEDTIFVRFTPFRRFEAFIVTLYDGILLF
jgi:hypothetical protein